MTCHSIILHIYPIDNKSFIATENEFEDEIRCRSSRSSQAGNCDSKLILYFFHNIAAFFSGRISKMNLSCQLLNRIPFSIKMKKTRMVRL